MEIENKFASLFRGLDRAHGLAIPTEVISARGKRETTYKTVRAPVPAGAWRRHLEGAEGLVITPVRDDGTCWFGAIDVDVYPLDIPELARKIAGLRLPLVTVRTKSGGAHLFLFLHEAAPAEAVQRRLRRWASILGYGTSEIFPKQHRLASQNDMGSGINLPYFGDARKAVMADGNEIPIDEFLTWAQRAAIPLDLLTGGDEPEESPPEEPGQPDEPTELQGAPPCLIHWAKQGIGEGMRNEVMFDFAVYCRKRWGDTQDWRAKLEQINQLYCSPPLGAAELLTIFKGVSSKTYTYKCKCQGPYCEPKRCRKREFGLGGGYTEVGFEVTNAVVVETKPKLAIFTINGQNVEFNYDALLDQKLFARILFEAIEEFHRPIKPEIWQKLVKGWLAKAERQEAPADSSPDGQLFQHMDHYRRRHPAKSRDELRLDGRAWYDVEEQRLYVKGRDLLAYLRRERAGNWTPPELFQAIKRLGGEKSKFILQGEPVVVWWVPMEPEITTSVPVPQEKKDALPF